MLASHPTSNEASADAVYAAKNAKQADELSREVHLAEAITKAAAETKTSLLEALKEVFGDGDEKRDPEQMRILIRRIPLICNDVKAINVGMDDIKGDIASINDNLKWAVRLIIGAVILGLLKLILIP